MHSGRDDDCLAARIFSGQIDFRYGMAHPDRDCNQLGFLLWRQYRHDNRQTRRKVYVRQFVVLSGVRYRRWDFGGNQLLGHSNGLDAKPPLVCWGARCTCAELVQRKLGRILYDDAARRHDVLFFAESHRSTAIQLQTEHRSFLVLAVAFRLRQLQATAFYACS